MGLFFLATNSTKKKDYAKTTKIVPQFAKITQAKRYSLLVHNYRINADIVLKQLFPFAKCWKKLKKLSNIVETKDRHRCHSEFLNYHMKDLCNGYQTLFQPLAHYTQPHRSLLLEEQHRLHLLL